MRSMNGEQDVLGGGKATAVKLRRIPNMLVTVKSHPDRP